jgi:hypothetical protein
MDLFKALATDKTAEARGVFREFGEGKFLIARATNPAYKKRISELVEQNDAVLKNKTPEAEALSEKLMIQVTAETLLLDWSPAMVIEDGGEPVPYSVQNAITALTNIGDFRSMVAQWANEGDAYRVAKLREKEKN